MSLYRTEKRKGNEMGKEERVFRPIPGLSREEEEKQLAQIIATAQENLRKTKEQIRKLSEELYDLMETYGTKDKEALALLHNTQSQLRERKRDLMRAEKARKKPYFGRIDFKDAAQPCEESYYVGRVGISRDGTEPVVIDWRAPAASVYYENTVGPCRYTVNGETVYDIDLKRKRTYEIANDRLKDFFDSDVVANDELLTKYLAKNKKAVLGEIIAAIQKEQNEIIRKSPKTNLIVQGAAGSGKTTVAMHRISYILYNYEEEFRAQDFYIIGSNRILLNYITSVLPDLDVYGVSQMTMEQLFVRLLYEDWNPRIHRIRPVEQTDPSVCLRGSSEWFCDLEQFCEAYEDSMIPKSTVCLEKTGAVLLEEKTIRTYLEQNPKMSMQSKTAMLNEMLLARLENECAGKEISYTTEEKKEWKRVFGQHFGKKVWNGSVFELYRDFLRAQAEKGKPEEEKEEFDLYDLAALAYLYKRIKETDGIREASHVIIDEAQDFGMMAYACLAYCLRGCTYTIMGDVSQNIHFGHGLNDWEELKALILTGPFDGFGLLQKSYRNTIEISEFAAEILRHGSFAVYPAQPIIRHGRDVQVTACADQEEMAEKTVRIIKDWQREGYETIAVICRDEKEADEVSSRLKGEIELSDGFAEFAEFGAGVMVLPVEYTKGLEFDAVLLYNPSKEQYPQEDAYVKLLYVAATRALHELSVVHQGDLTDLIGKKVSREKKMPFLQETGPKSSSVRRQKEEAGVHRTAEAGEREGGSCKAARQKITRDDPASTAVNPSPHRFRDCPDHSALRPIPPGNVDFSVQSLRKTKRYLDVISPCGTVRLTPVGAEIIRVQFRKGQAPKFDPGYWNYEPERPVLWTARQGRDLVEIAAGNLTVRVDKKTGAVMFFNKEERRLLAEKANLPRQTQEEETPRTWTHFDWKKEEKLWAKGNLPGDFERMNQKARYISFGGRKLRMPLLISSYGYGIAVAAPQTVMCCDIPMYGTYVYTDGTGQIDYYFLYGREEKRILELYGKLQ